MKRATIVGGAFAIVLVLLALAAGHRALEKHAVPAAAKPPAVNSSTTPEAETSPGFLYGRITTTEGATYQGRLRWGGGNEEAFWSDSFNGVKRENPWLALVPAGQLPKERHPIEFLGIEITHRERPISGRRPLVASFGDLVRIEARGREVQVTLKSGTVFDLDRLEASDFDDDVRVWDAKRGVVDLDSLRVRTIELLPSPHLAGAIPYRLHGTVHTRQGDFTGFVQWNREEAGVGTDKLAGYTADGTDDSKLSLRFDTLRSIARRSRDSSLVTLRDGREIVLSDTPDVGHDNRGIYVDDPRYGRVLISWDAFERADFSGRGSGAPEDTGPAYGDFPPGHPLTGSVTTLAGRRLTGRLVYDLDESETTETLDAPSQGGVDYTLPFGLIASIVRSGGDEPGAQRARVVLQNGKELRLEPTGDLGNGNGGLLVFADGQQRPEYVPWTDVERIDFDHGGGDGPPAQARPQGSKKDSDFKDR